MSATHGPLATFAGKELHGTLRTWRLWVLPGVMVFFALSSPVLAKLLPVILENATGSGLDIDIPTPTAADSYLQFMQNLGQLVTLVVVIVGAMAIAAERRAGTAILVLTKPISRTGFILTKALSQFLLLVCATLVSAALCITLTAALFGTASIGPFLQAAGLWLIFATMLLMIVTAASAAMKSQGAAIGIGVAVWIVLLVLASFPVIRNHSPVGLVSAGTEILTGGEPAVLWPIVTGVVAIAVFLGAAVWLFRRSEL
jgi:ABC-2 type transport system permease protein